MHPPPAAAPPRILVVEDGRACLRRPGREVRTADDSDERGVALICAEMDGVAGLRSELTRRRTGARGLLRTTGDDDGRGALPRPDGVEAVIETLTAAQDGREASYGAPVGGAAGTVP